MEEMVVHVTGVVAPVAFCVFVGYGWAFFNQPFDNKMIGSLLSGVGYPTLIISHLSKQHVSLGAFLHMMLAAVSVVACFALIGSVILLLLRLPIRAYLSPMMLGNVGNIGLPICLLAFGAPGLAYAMAFMVVVTVAVFTVGQWLPEGKVSLNEIVRSPVVYSVVLSILLMATDTRLPTTIERTFSILGGFAIPLMLLMLGHTLATLNTGALWRGCTLAICHLAIAVVVAFALSHLFAFEGVARGVFILQCLMPVSVVSYLWVESYAPQHAPSVAGFILISTLLAVVMLPVVLTVWI